MNYNYLYSELKIVYDLLEAHSESKSSLLFHKAMSKLETLINNVEYKMY